MYFLMIVVESVEINQDNIDNKYFVVQCKLFKLVIRSFASNVLF